MSIKQDVLTPLLEDQSFERSGADDAYIKEIDVAEMLRHPEEVISAIEKYGVIRLGEMEIEDSVAIRAFNGRSLITLGAPHREDMDWQAMWYAELDKSRQGGRLVEAGWTESVTVEAHVVSIRYAAGPPGVGLLQPILLRYQGKACSLSVFGLPAVQAVLDYKWEAWAARLLKFEFMVYLAWLLSFTIFVILFRDEKRLDGNFFLEVWNADTDVVKNRIKVVLNFAAVFFMLPFVMIEVNTMFDYGIHWLQLWNLLDMVTYSSQVLTCVVYVTGWQINSEWFSILLAIQCIFLFAKVQYFSRVFASANSSLVDTLKVVLQDVKWFLVFILLTLFSFGLAFFVLYRNEQLAQASAGEEGDRIVEFDSILHSIVSMFSFMLGGFDFHIFFATERSWDKITFFVVYEFIMAVMLLNLLIAVMTDSYSKVMEDERLWNLCSKAQIIDELETTLPKWLVRRWNPPFVHILKICPRKTVNMNSLWDRLDLTESRLVSTSKEMSIKMGDMEHRIMRRLEFLSKELELMHEVDKKNGEPSRKVPQTSGHT